MADVQHFSGVVTPVGTTTARCGQHISYGSAPTSPDPFGIWFDTDKNCLAWNDDDGTTYYLPGDNGAADQVLTSNGANAVPTWKTHPAHVAGGADKQLQVNNATAFGGISNGNAGEVLVSAGAAAFPAFAARGMLLHGVVPPVDATDGTNGDFFIDTATNTLYGPKAGGVWPVGVILTGGGATVGVTLNRLQRADGAGNAVDSLWGVTDTGNLSGNADGAKVTVYRNVICGGMGVAPIYAEIHDATQTNPLVDSVLATIVGGSGPLKTGLYRLTYFACTRDVGTGTTATVTVTWTGIGGAKSFTSATFALNSGSITGQVEGIINIKPAAGDIKCSVTIDSIGTSSYDYYFALEQVV